MARRNQQPTQPASPFDPQFQQPVQQAGATAKKPSKLVTVVATIFVLILACVIGISISNCREQQQADKYGADAPYTVTGTVKKADERYSSNNNSKTYHVIIETEEELPDGTHTFESRMSRDLVYVKKHEGETLSITIGEDGHIDTVKPLKE